MNLRPQINGFTFTETVVYLGVFGFVFLAIMQFFFTISAGNRFANEEAELHKAMVFVNDHFTQTFSESNLINTINSTLNDDNGILRLENTAEFYEYRIQSGRIVFNNNGVSNPITPDDFAVSRMRFEVIYNQDDEVTGTRVIITATSNRIGEITNNFETAYVL